ncbi:NADP-binding protein [Dacryopinax primogenitus]|uniref:NADP-binding protein n=1 Tax=Dacryopinax primogenitus (strain DJM 731) TaxID=1858805 RepID=M5GD73_DACPD|nr:NADP-binding protein [Dacryopinax primogenitus]EJU04312.1 NADP-binding protein [Dacryopinax primogenitus]
MRAIVINSYMHPSDRTVSNDAPEPTLGKNNVLVEVESAALNFFDILQSQGKYQNQPPLPYVLGAELAGTISPHSPIPKGCKLKPGDRVFGYAQGAFAERAACDYRTLFPIPKGMTFDQAAGLYVTYPTSYEGIVNRGETKPGEWVLVHAGAGGVGLVAVQIAKALGAKVIATAGSPPKLEICKSIGGADEVLDYTKSSWQKEVLRITGGKGVDVVYDPVGLIKDSLKCIAWKGRAVVVGFAAGKIEQVPTNLILLKNVSLVGIHWGAYLKNEPGHVPDVWKGIFKLFESGKLIPAVYDPPYMGLDSVPRALVDLENRKTWGKAVVRVREMPERAKL